MAAHLNAAVHAMLAGLALGAPSAYAQAVPSTFDDAMHAYSVQHYRLAFDGLARLADAGDGEAARIALLMVAHGPRLFSERFDAPPSQRARWLQLAHRNEASRMLAAQQAAAAP